MKKMKRSRLISTAVVARRGVGVRGWTMCPPVGINMDCDEAREARHVE